MGLDNTSLLSKYIGEEEGNSLKFMQRMIYLVFSEVVYQRALLPREHFTEKHVFGSVLHLPDTTKDRRQVALHNHLKGAAEAVEGKRLKQYHLMVHSDRNDPSAASEVFIMDVVYAEEEGEMSMEMTGEKLSNVRVCYRGVEELQKQTREVFRTLRRGLSTLVPITRNVSFSFYITYRDGVDRAYHPKGYGQAARPYVLPETAEIGDMGMLHAREHACLLKVKSLMLEDGFQLMQKNAATQHTDSQSASASSSADPSQEGSDVQSSGDKASSFGVFDDHSDFDDGEEQGDQRSIGDQRSMGDQRSAGRDQRSLAASTRTMRFEQTSSVLDRSFSVTSDDASMELGTAIDDDFPSPQPSKLGEMDEFDFSSPSQPAKEGTQSSAGDVVQALQKGRDATAKETKPSTVASTTTLVAKNLAAADEKREQEKQDKSRASSAVTPSDKSLSTSSADAVGSEASEVPQPNVRRASLRKRQSLPKVAEESLSTESGDEPSADEAAKDLEASAAPAAKESSGKEADSEPSDDTVPKKGTMARRRADRRKPSKEKAATVPDESMDQEKEIADPPKKQTKGRGRKSAEAPKAPEETGGEDTVAEKAPKRRGRSAGKKGTIEKPATVPDESMEMEEIAETPKSPADSMEVNEQSTSGESAQIAASKAFKDKSASVETPKRPRGKAQVEVEIRTPGEGVRFKRET